MTLNSSSETGALHPEWRDPQQVVPHMAHLLEELQAKLHAVEQDLAVVLGALEPETDQRPIDLPRWIEGIRGRVLEAESAVGQRAVIYKHLAEELRR